MRHNEESEMRIYSGQIILIGTDGIKETSNEVNECFGDERIKAVIREHAEMPTKVILNAVFDVITNFRASNERENDETLIVVKVL